MSRTDLLDPAKAALIVVDVQVKLLPFIYKHERLVEKCRVLTEGFKSLGVPVILTEQYPRGLGATHESVLGALPPDAQKLEKVAFGCLGDDGITESLMKLDRKQIVVCGMETHICVMQTALQLLAAGFEVHLIRDAVSSRDPKNRDIGIDRMVRAGAVSSCVEMALFELMRDCKHPQFRAVQKLIK